MPVAFLTCCSLKIQAAEKRVSDCSELLHSRGKEIGEVHKGQQEQQDISKNGAKRKADCSTLLR